MKKYLAALIFFLATLGLLVLLSFTPYLELLELKGYDFMLAVLRGPLDPPTDIVVVAIDQTSMENFQEDPELRLSWPWPRWIHGALIDQLNAAGVRAIVFDVVFDLDQDPQSDDDMASSIRASQVPVILAATQETQEDPNHGTVLTKQVLPIEKFVQAGAWVGYVTMHPDSADEVLRHALLSVQGRPSLAVEAYRAATGQGIDALALPVVRYQGQDPEILINYCGGARHIPTVSYYQAIDYDRYLPASALRGKVAIVGMSQTVQDISQGMTKDTFATPFGAAVPGPEVHANVLNTLLRRNFLDRAGPLENWIVLTLLSLILSLVVLRVESFRWKIILSLGVVVAYLALASLLLVFGRYWIYTAQPTFAMLAVFGFNTLYQYRQTEKERAHIRKALKGYVSSQVMAEILKDPASLELGGTQVEATVLFSDIQGFSKISEKTPPRELFALLNDYFYEIGDAIMAHEGMINKYIGDAVMAIWNVPKPNPRHAVLACQAALEMRRIVERKRPLNARVGLNTGQMIAGNLGHAERMEYTVIGDAVNLASRLEGANKPFKTSIMISESTEELVRGQFLLRLLDRIRVVGKQQPVRVYELLAGVEEDIPEEKHRMVQSFERIIEAYEARDWGEAIARAEEHLKHFPADQVGVIYLERCREFQATPPPADWDGVYVLKSK